MWKFVNSKVFSYILIVIGVIVGVSMCNSNTILRDNIKLYDDNIFVLSDSIVTIKKENDTYESSISGYVADAKELEKFNEKLAKQVKRQDGKVITLNNTVLQLKMDKGDLEKTIDDLNIKYRTTRLNDSSWVLDWVLPYMLDSIKSDSLNYDVFTGSTQFTINGNLSLEVLKSLKIVHNSTVMTKRFSQMTATFGQKKVDGKVRVFIESKHPYISPVLLEGVYIDYPKTKHWFQGFGAGPSAGIGINVLGQPMVYIGLGFHFNVWKK